MSRSRFSTILNELDDSINRQEEFNKEQSMSELSVMIPKMLNEDRKDDLKSSLILSLRETLNQHKEFVETVPIALIVHRHGGVVATNAEFRRLQGYDNPEELIGRSIMDLIAPENRADITSRVHRIVGKGATHNPPMEMVALKKNGERIHVEAEAVPIIYEGEKAIVVILRDITQKKKAQESLRLADENFQNIIRQMPDGVLIKDESQVLFANESFARMLEYGSSDELKGTESIQLVHPDYRIISQDRSQKLLTEGGSNPLCKFKMIGKQGKVVDVETASMAIEYYGKKAVMAVMRDMTMQNRMERQAVNNDKLATLGTLAAGVAHEVNNPLTFVLGNLTFLQEQVDEIKVMLQQKGVLDGACEKLLAEMTEEITEVTHGGERIRDIVKGLKSFARNGDDKAEKVDLNQVIEASINMTFHMMKQKARLEKDMAVNLPTFTANSGKLQQVFMNLFVNASQAIVGNRPSENKITVRTGRQDGNLFVEVSDTGRGIPAEVLPRIFDPFFTTKPVGEGTGLGLAVCNEILRHFQGSMEVRSEVGKGTTFTVYLPLENGLSTGKDAVEVNNAAKVEKKLGRVLVVDDEPGNLDVISKGLRKDYDVVSALSGVEAMAVLTKGGDQVDAIVSDINMPEMDGVTLFKTVAKVFPGMEKKMIFITGGIFSEGVNEFLKGIPNYCLEKPFRQDDLKLAIAQCVTAGKEGSL
jgi:two-component system, cell cycle sensor histidine kinase and response regulator CckA